MVGEELLGGDFTCQAKLGNSINPSGKKTGTRHGGQVVRGDAQLLTHTEAHPEASKYRHRSTFSPQLAPITPPSISTSLTLLGPVWAGERIKR